MIERKFESVETRGDSARACEGFAVPVYPPNGDWTWELVAVVACSDGVLRLFWRREIR